MMLAFLPPPEESNPALALLKVGGLTAVLLGGGALIYLIGSGRARRAVRV
jgi:hypothetical protein